MKLLLVTLLLFSTYSFSQKQYVFDYLIETEHTFYKDSIRIKNHQYRQIDTVLTKYYLTNSKNSDYIAVIFELDSLSYKLKLRDEKNGLASSVTFLKSDLNKADILNIHCNHILRYSNRYADQTKNYVFNKLSDTLINGEVHKIFTLKSIKPKIVKRQKLGTAYYIIKNRTAFHLPIFNRSTAYKVWKRDGNLPNGIFLEKYYIDYDGQLYSNQKLINYWKTDKTIVLGNDCD